MKTLILSLVLFFYSNSAQADTLEYVLGSSVYAATLKGHPKCKGKEAQVFFVRDNVVNYQIPVPAGGDFVVHLMPGNYSVVSIDEGGCLAQREINVIADKHIKDTIVLKHVDKKTSKNILQKISNALFPNAHAMSMCIHCLQSPMMGVNPMSYNSLGGYPRQRFGYPTPYWGPFGHWSFNRFSSPCPMGPLYPGAYAVTKKEKTNRAPAGMAAGFAAPGMMPPSGGIGGNFTAGCQGSLYPGGGSMVAGKPIVYFHGPKGQKINFNVKLTQKSNFLASTPILPQKGGKFEINGEGGIKKGDVDYPYFFYDVRTDMKDVQEIAGSCVQSVDLVKTMVGYLEEAGFNESEQKDFYSYWNVKLPKLDKVCVFPQISENVESMSIFKINPTPDHVTRMVFVLVPVVNGKMPKQTFAKLPQKPWTFEKSKRSPASANFVIREWGVAFLTVPEVENFGFATGSMQL